jgi:TonB family protein
VIDAAPIEAPTQLPTTEPAVTGQATTSSGVVTGQILVGNPLGDILGEIPVDDFDQDPEPINKVQPKVPVGASGIVRVQVTVLTTGKVSRAKVLDQTPFAAAIQEAASQCTFRPAKRRGKSVPVTWVIAYALETKR